MIPSPPAPAVARLAITALAALVSLAPRTAPAQIPLEGAADPHWIWAPLPSGSKGTYPAQTRYLRRRFEVKENGSTLTLDATADDAFTLYLDGKEVARGADPRSPKHVEAKLAAGPHALAAEVTNDAPGPAGFLLRGALTPLGQVAPVHTDANWKAAPEVKGDDWKSPTFDDSTWTQAVDLGPLGTAPWGDLAFESGDTASRFKVPEGFAVTVVAAPDVTGSAIALAFDEKGTPCVSIERGPVARLIDADKDGRYESRTVIAPQMNTCQGFNFLKGKLYAVGNGPQGVGIYRLSDDNGDGVYTDRTELVRAVDGAVGEHGPHSIQLGPDGSLYFNAGNHAHLKGPIDPKSPCNIAYEGELLPHYNDPRGHAVDIKAPGGEIYRSDDEGKTWVRVAQGFRNHYDFAFNADGEIFTFDSDMEWDIGLPWYRPVRINHAIPGAEFGWRNGSAPWSDYYFDSLPATLNIGRGSPTGVTFYQATAFPIEYSDNLLACDWSQGRILAIKLERSGATYTAKETTLVSGQPLNVTDIEVGPDGAVYFTTGGRQTRGGLYRVAFKGPVKPYGLPLEPYPLDALNIDSPLSAFSRAKVEAIRKAHEATWAKDLMAVATDVEHKPTLTRLRALDLLAETGAKLDKPAIPALIKDESLLIHAKLMQLLGANQTDAPAEAVSLALRLGLEDADPLVRRRACEALVRSGGPIPSSSMAPLLTSDDRWLRYAARIALEHGRADALAAVAEAAPTFDAYLEACLALVRTTGIRELPRGRFARTAPNNREAVVDQQLRFLRLVGLTLRSPRDEAKLGPPRPGFIDFQRGVFERMVTGPREEGFRPVYAETARLLAALNDGESVPLILKAMASEPHHATQVHYANCLRNIKSGWTRAQKQQYWSWFDTASKWEAGFSYLGYLDFMLQDFLAFASTEEKAALFAEADRHPFPSRVLIRSIDLDADPAKIAALPALYAALATSDNPNAAGDLRLLVLEKLGQAKRPEAHAALRELAKSDPDRRDFIARALCNNPTPDDLPNLAAALASRDPNTTSQVVNALMTLDRKPEGASAMRDLLRLARRTGPAMLGPMNALASKWTGTEPPADRARDFDASLAFWRDQFAKAHPDEAATLDDATGGRIATRCRN